MTTIKATTLTTEQVKDQLMHLIADSAELWKGAASFYLQLLDIVEESEKPKPGVKILKQKKGVVTVIEWNGERYTYDSPSTFRGGVKRK